MRSSVFSPSRSSVRAPKRLIRAEVSQQPRFGFVRATGTPSSSSAPREKIFDLLDMQGAGFYKTTPELTAAVNDLIAANPTQDPGFKSLSAGQGTWQVFHAPHIENMSNVLQVKFNPIRYHLEGTSIVSNVKFEAPFVGTGWLSASGSMMMKTADSVEVNFDKFWIDMGDKLRTQVSETDISDPISQAILQMGRASFFPQFSVFPVLYLDEDFCVFKFPPLDTKIAVRRVLALPLHSSANMSP